MLQKYLDYVQPSPSCPLYPLPFLIHILTVSFLGSRSRSRRSREVLTFRARDRAMRPPVLISFSRRSRRSSLGLSAMNSATATAPRAHNNRRPVKNAKIQHTRTHTRKNYSWGTNTSFPTFTGQLGGSKAQPEHRAVGDQPVFQLVDSFVTHRIMAEVQSLQTLCAWLRGTIFKLQVEIIMNNIITVFCCVF